MAISDKELRTKIRVEAEKEEKRFYDERVPEEWKRSLHL